MTSRRINNNHLLDKIGKSQGQKQINKPLNRQGKDFRQVLDKIQSSKSEVKISKHASQRLEMRNVKITEKQLNEVSEAMDRASAKGIKDALILLDGNALIASVQNKTIVTCAKQEGLDSKIITNIDGAIVL